MAITGSPTSLMHDKTQFIKGHIDKPPASSSSSNPMGWLKTAQVYTTALGNLIIAAKDGGFYPSLFDKYDSEKPLNDFYILLPSREGLLGFLPTKLQRIIFTTNDIMARIIYKNCHRNGTNEEGEGQDGIFELVLAEEFRHMFANPSSKIEEKYKGKLHAFFAEKKLHKEIRPRLEGFLSIEALKSYGYEFVNIAHECILTPLSQNGTISLKGFVDEIAMGGIARTSVGHPGPFKKLIALNKASSDGYAKLILGLDHRVPFDSIDQLQAELMKELNKALNEEEVKAGFLGESLKARLANAEESVKRLSLADKEKLTEEALRYAIRKEMDAFMKQTIQETVKFKREQILERELFDDEEVNQFEIRVQARIQREINEEIERNFAKLTEDEFKALIASKKQSLTQDQLEALLVEYFKELIKEEIFNTGNLLLNAGLETTSASLSLAICGLAADPAKLKELRDYVERILKENEENDEFDFLQLRELVKTKLETFIRTMRFLNGTPVFGFPRVFSGDTTLVDKGNYTYFEKGDLVFYSIYLAAKHAQQKKGLEVKEADYLPFSIGPQRCPGEKFSIFALLTYLLHIIPYDIENLTTPNGGRVVLKQDGPVAIPKVDQQMKFTLASPQLLEKIKKLPYKSASRESKKEV